KWRQMRLARALERAWSKDEILEAYLNLASFRGELEGVGGATAGLLGRAPHGVTRAAALVPAALLAAPHAPAAARPPPALPARRSGCGARGERRGPPGAGRPPSLGGGRRAGGHRGRPPSRRTWRAGSCQRAACRGPSPPRSTRRSSAMRSPRCAATSSRYGR